MLFDIIGEASQPFVHKRLIPGVVGLFTGGPVAGVGAFLGGGGGGGGRNALPAGAFRHLHPSGAQHTHLEGRPSEAHLAWARGVKFSVDAPTSIAAGGLPGSCPGALWVLTTGGMCRHVISGAVRPQTGLSLPGGGAPGGPVGDAVMGRYGAALVPGNMVVNRAVCLRGMQLGDDDLCYNRGQITNKQRAWPRGRKPLLTGGEMRAISIAATAGRRLERTAKRLQKIGLMKKPPPRRKAITSGPTEHHHH